MPALSIDSEGDGYTSGIWLQNSWWLKLMVDACSEKADVSRSWVEPKPEADGLQQQCNMLADTHTASFIQAVMTVPCMDDSVRVTETPPICLLCAVAYNWVVPVCSLTCRSIGGRYASSNQHKVRVPVSM